MVDDKIKDLIMAIRILRGFLAVSVLIVFSAACADISIAQNSSQDLRKRVEEFWQARVAGDWVTCYKYEEVGKLKKAALSDYVRHQGNLIYKSAKVLGVKIDKKGSAEAKVAIEYAVSALGVNDIFKRNIVDKWVYIDGDWYHHIEKHL